jgi:hypothetical protein
VGVRTTDLGIASHTRLVYTNVIPALREAFDGSYSRDSQLADLRITQNYPLKKIDYPCVVVEYQPQSVMSAGVGHVEWFTDPRGRWRKWKHNRFEGTLSLRVFALTTKDRDIISDALVELIRFGDLDPQLNKFFEVIYPQDGDLTAEEAEAGYTYSYNAFDQLMLNSDQLYSLGNSAQIAPWAPEDVLVYSGGWSTNLHGSYYNVYPTVDWSRVTRIRIEAYTTDQYGLPFDEDLTVAWVPPFDKDDEATITGTAVISADESQDGIDDLLDAATAWGHALIAANERRYSDDAETVAGAAAVTGDEEYEAGP